MQTKTKTVTKTVYICDNCGAEHSSDSKLRADYVTGLEICDKCQILVPLVDRTMYYDEYDKSFGEVYDKNLYVNKDMVQATELDLELDDEVYRQKVAEARQLFMDLLDKIDTEYLKGKVRDLDVTKYIKELS